MKEQKWIWILYAHTAANPNFNAYVNLQQQFRSGEKLLDSFTLFASLPYSSLSSSLF